MPTRNPRLLELLARARHIVELLLDRLASEVLIVDELMSELLERGKGGIARVDLRAILLVSLEERLGGGDVIGELVARHQLHHAIDPGEQVAVIAAEALEVVAVQQSLLARVRLRRQPLPLVIELPLQRVDLLGRLRVRMAELGSFLVEHANFLAERREVALDALVLALQRLHRAQVAAEVLVV